MLLGTGGVITGLSIASDGTMVSRTDTFGGYYWSPTQNQWVQILNSNILSGVDNQQVFSHGGFDEIWIDPTNTANLWFLWQGKVYKSNNRGASFSLTNFSVSDSSQFISNNNSVDSWAPYAAVDPANSNVVYVSTPSRGLQFSNDGGSTWSVVSGVSAGLPPNVPNNPNSSPKAGTDTTSVTVGTGSKTFSNNSASFGFSIGAGNIVQVWETSNPTNQMIGSVTASSGASFTLNVTQAFGSGTASDWSVSNVNATGGGHRIVFDSSNGTQSVGGQTRTSNVFVHTYNVNTWKSTDGGQTWSPVTSSGRPTAIRQMCIDPFGVLWCIDDDFPGSNSNLSKYDTTTWTAHINTNAPSGAVNTWWSSIAVDAANSSAKGSVRIAVAGTGGQLHTALSADAGTSWNQQTGNSYVSSGDVDWLANYFTANPSAFFSTTSIAFDATHLGRMYMGSEGPWYMVPATSGANITANIQSRGVEEFIGIKVVSANANACIVTCWDFPGFYKDSAHFGSYPTAIGLPPGNSQVALERGYSVDWLWSNPLTMVCVVQDGTGGNNSARNFSGISTDGGQTWTGFTTKLNAAAGGAIAISDINTMVWGQTNTIPEITTDGGSTWNPISIPGGTPTGDWSPFTNFGTYAKYIESDKANGDIYIYNVNINNGGPDGFYKYTKATGLWSHQAVSLGVGALANFNGVLKSSGATAGHLFFTPGIQSPPHPASTSFYFTTDGWATNSIVSGFQEVQAFGFGAIDSVGGHTYPTIFVVGSRSNVYAIWMCKDFNTAIGVGTWKQCGTQYPMGILSNVTDIDGDKFVVGKVYVNSIGGAFWGQF